MNELMSRLTSRQKEEIKARVESFPKSSFKTTLSPSLCRVYRTFHGRDFKVLAQISLFILWEYLTPDAKKYLVSSIKGMYVYLGILII